MTDLVDKRYAAFQGLKLELQDSLIEGTSEADTRLRVLDRILFEIMGWKHEAVTVEPPTQSGYIDYLLTVGEKKNVLIIEAKKAGFLKPATKAISKSVVALSGPVAKPLRDGIEQARRYASEKGVAVAVLTDGNVWLFFQATRTDGVAPLDGKGILFTDFKAVEEYFAIFTELLAPQAIIDRRHLDHLADVDEISIPEAEQQYYVLPPDEGRLRVRDSLANDASLLFSQFFSRLTDGQDKEMLRDCFVETSESRKADLEFEKIIQKVLNTISTIDTASGGALQAEIERTIASQRSETVLLIGNKGSGKSTFIDRFFEHVLPADIRQKCALARIDLAEYHGGSDKISDWSIVQLRETLELSVCTNNPPSYDDLMGIFFSEYQRWSTGTYRPLYESDKVAFKIKFGEHIESRREQRPDEYVRLLLAWAAKGQGRLSCIVFDNTDQFPVEVQDRVYQLAHSLESTAPVFIIVPITDRTVWRLSKAGALQSYAAKSFFLPVPDAKEIIARRVNFLKNKLEVEKGAKHYFSRKGFNVEINDLRVLADAVEHVFINHDYATRLIGQLGNFDIRRMLKIAERIFLSPEIKIDDIIKSRFGGDAIIGNWGRTYRALLQGEYDRYVEADNEFITNIFYTDPKKPGSPLLSYYILWILRQQMSGVHTESVEEKHLLVADVCDFLTACTVPGPVTLQAIRRLYERRLIESLDPNVETVNMSDRVAIKESGLAHLELALTAYVYIEQMAVTTGINLRSVRDELRGFLRRSGRQKFGLVRDTFAQYLLTTDAGRIVIPARDAFRQLREARERFRAVIGTRPNEDVWQDGRAS
jgi:predicted type IV restriction endonuclease